MVISHKSGFNIFYHPGYIRSSFYNYTLENLEIPVHLTHTQFISDKIPEEEFEKI